jgi:hypothetical protein
VALQKLSAEVEALQQAERRAAAEQQVRTPY